jgi:hypothetical protein
MHCVPITISLRFVKYKVEVSKKIILNVFYLIRFGQSFSTEIIELQNSIPFLNIDLFR